VLKEKKINPSEMKNQNFLYVKKKKLIEKKPTVNHRRLESRLKIDENFAACCVVQRKLILFCCAKLHLAKN
jgi:hypothetical protein